MWQIIDLSDKISFDLIDGQTIRYNLSAWIGGYFDQDDNVVVTLTFLNSNKQMASGNYNSFGPVLRGDRGTITQLVYREIYGVIPASTRSILVCVTIYRLSGSFNNGYLDNAVFYLY